MREVSDHGGYAGDGGSFHDTFKSTDGQARQVSDVVHPLQERPRSREVSRVVHPLQERPRPREVAVVPTPVTGSDNERKSAASVHCQYFSHRPSDTSGDHHLVRDQTTHNLQTSIVEVRVFWVPSPRSPGAGVPRPSDEPGRIIVQRVTACAPPGKSSWTPPILTSPTGILTSPTGESGESDSVTETLQDAFDDYVAKHLMDPDWEKFANGWATPVCEDVASAAERVSGVRDQWHQLILGEPVQSLTGLTPLSDIAAEVALPGDTLFRNTKLLVEGIGIGIGLASGQPLLVNACVKSFIHDAALKAVSKGIGGLLTETLDPADTREQDAPHAQNEFARQVQELGDDIEGQPEFESSNYLIQLDYLEDQGALDMPDTLFRLQEHRDLNDPQASGWDATPDNGYTVQEHRSNDSQDHPRDCAGGRE